MKSKGVNIVVIGNQKVGKQTLCCYLYNSKLNHLRQNIFTKTNLSVYKVDTIRSISQRMNKPSICLFMCDVSNEKSIQYAVLMAKLDNQFLTKDSVIILVGNKCDLQVHQSFNKTPYVIDSQKTGKWRFMHHFLISITQEYGIEALMDKIIKQVQNLSMKKAERHIALQIKNNNRKPFKFDTTTKNLLEDKDKMICTLKQQIAMLKQQLTSKQTTIDGMNLQWFKKISKINQLTLQNALLIEQIEKIRKEEAKMKMLYYQARQNLALIEDERLKKVIQQNSNHSIMSEMEEFSIKQNKLKLELEKMKKQCLQLEKICHYFTEMSVTEFIENKLDIIIMYRDYRFQYYGVEDNSEIVQQEKQSKFVESTVSQKKRDQEEIYQILA